MNNQRRDEDLEWLYRREPAAVESTRVFSESELAQLNAGQQPAADSAAAFGAAAERPAAQLTAAQQAATGPARATQPGQYPQSQLPQAAPAGAAPSPGHYLPAPPTGPAGTPPPPPPAAGRSRRRRKGHPIRNSILLLILAWLAFMIGTPIYALTSGTVIDATPDGQRPASQPGTAILLAGSDAREDLTPQQRKQLQTGSTEGRRTDTMLILYTPPKGRSALISLPRDSYVEIPGHGKNKLNAAYAFGGPKLLVKTVEAATGIRIDGYFEIGFAGLSDTVEAVGGVEVCLKQAIKDRDSHLDLPAGCQTLNGPTALGYVRMRKADLRGDLGRMERQREVIGKVAGKAINPLYWLNPVTYWKLNMAVSSSVKRSESVGLGELGSAASGMIGTATGSTMSLTVPISQANARTSGGASIMLWDKTASKEMFDAIKAGNTDGLAKFEK